ncbi:MAG TPA: LCP family protein [Candidatus Subteraquimicrobiales bacterium]
MGSRTSRRSTFGPRRKQRLQKKREKQQKISAYVDFLVAPIFGLFKNLSRRSARKELATLGRRAYVLVTPIFRWFKKILSRRSSHKESTTLGPRTGGLHAKKKSQKISVYSHVSSLLASIGSLVTSIYSIYSKKRDSAPVDVRGKHALNKNRLRGTTVFAGVIVVLLLALFLKNFLGADRRLTVNNRNKVVVKPAVYYHGGENTYLILEKETKDVMIMSYKPLKKRIKTIFIAKETFTQIPDYGFGEISEAVDLGMPDTLATIKNLLGLDVSNYLITKTGDLKNLGTPNLFDKAFTEATMSNLSDKERLKIAEELAKIEPQRIDVFPLPVKSIAVHQEAYLEPQTEKVEELVKSIWGDSETQVKVMILNGSGQPGVGERLAKKLADEGFEVRDIRNAESFNYNETRILMYRQKKAAVEIRDLLGVGVLVDAGISSNIADITIVVGRDYAENQ